MKLTIFLLLALSMSACTKSDSGSGSNSSAPSNQAGMTKTEKPAKAVVDPNAPPVEFTFLGITPDKQNIAYRIKVNTDKPIEEVHMALKEKDASGKVVQDTTLIWQNIVHSTRQPIEAGQTYEDTSYVDPKVTSVDCTLKEVVYKDNTRWSPK